MPVKIVFTRKQLMNFLQKQSGFRTLDHSVIICTGHSDILNERKAYEMGIRAFLMKPLNLTNLAEKVRNVLDESV